MNRKQLHALAKERVKDAKALLGRKRWAAAYYLAGYAVECGLKACVLRHIEATGAIFADAKYLKDLAGCWTHDLDKLIALAGLGEKFGVARGQNAMLRTYWEVVEEWDETSRYQVKAEREARQLYEAITDQSNGVLQWIQSNW